MATYPQSRADVGAPPNPETAHALVREGWDLGVRRVRPLDLGDSIHPRLYLVDVAEERLLFRANPGWDGPVDPAQVCRFVHHLSSTGAPVPDVLARRDGALAVGWHAYTISLETVLPGTRLDSGCLDPLEAAGSSLATVHRAAHSYDEAPGCLRGAGHYVSHVLETALATVGSARNTIGDLSRRIEAEYGHAVKRDVPWLMCHGDVRSGNALVDQSGAVRYTDFCGTTWAPALTDVLMPWLKWLMGDPRRRGRWLGVDEAARFLQGYCRLRPLTEAEIAVMPAVWAAWLAARLADLSLSWEGKEDRLPFCAWQVPDWLLTIADRALPMGRDLLARSGLSSD